jgi:AraC-like DNA-binding protein
MPQSVKLPPWDFRRGIATARVLTLVGCERGADLDLLLQDTGISRLMLDDPRAELEAQQEIQLIRNLLRALGNPAELGLEVGRRFTLKAYGMWSYALLSSTTLGDALVMAARMINQTYALTRNVVARVGDQVIVTYHDEHLPPDIRRFVVDRDRATVSSLQREILGQAIRYDAIEMKQSEPEPALAERYADTFGIRPTYGAPQHRSILSAALLAEPLPPVVPATIRQCEDLCRTLVEANSSRTGVAATVRDRLLRNPGRIPDMEAIAAEMHMTSRTLRRHLTAEGATFRTLLEEVRSTLAVELMARARLTHAEIAERLGYADVTTFIEAFRRWKGMPPSEYRRRQGLRPPMSRQARDSLSGQPQTTGEGA